MIEIFADMRETRSNIIAALSAMEGFNVTVGALSSGDYRLSEEVIVERKSAIDFVASIMDKRLFEQVAKMKIEYPRQIILIEGDIYKTRSAIDRKAITGAMSWLVGIEDMRVIQVSDSSETPLMLATLARHLQEGLGYKISLRAEKPKTSDLGSRYLLEGSPGIGPGIAEKLFDHFECALDAFNASPAELSQVKGVGIKVAERMYQALRHRKTKA